MKGGIISQKVKLRELRLEMGLTQQELADSLNMNSRYISMLESGVKPCSDKMVKKVELLLQSKQSPDLPLAVPSTCPQCTAKDKELYKALEIIKMQAKTIADLTCIVKNLKEDNDLNEPVARASGAGNGLKNSPVNKKGA